MTHTHNFCFPRRGLQRTTALDFWLDVDPGWSFLLGTYLLGTYLDPYRIPEAGDVSL